MRQQQNYYRIQTREMIKNLNQSLEYKRNPQQKLMEYQRNMKIFITAVEKQMAAIIDKYEIQINQLKNQNARLKNQLIKRNAKLDVSEQLSPIKFRSSAMTDIKRTNSNFMEDFPMKTFFGLDSKIQNTQNTYKKMPSFDYKFQIQSTPDKLSKSRFQVAKNNSKQKQQELIQSLQTGKVNLQQSTSKMFELVGHTSRQQEQTTVQNQETDQKDSNSKKKKGSEKQKLNSSLSSICESLDNSFHGKRAQAKSQKKRKEKNAKEQQEKKKHYESQKKRKQQGLKNLLTSMRQNIDASPQRPPQIIKGSKLLTTGDKNPSVQLSKAKVMINPVAVDISNRNKIKQQNSVQTSPSKNPTSILKNSSNNFFSKSIQNISAISFHDTSVYE